MSVRGAVWGLIAALLVSAGCAKKPGGLIAAGPRFEKDLQTALINAKPGATVELPEGRFEMTGTLSLTVPDVTIRGQGMDRTVLAYGKQTSGSAGILATANGFTLEGLTIQNTKGDAVKINGADGVTVRNVKAEWTGGPTRRTARTEFTRCSARTC